MRATPHELRRQVALMPHSAPARLALAEHLATEQAWTAVAEQASLAVGCDCGLLRAHELLVRAYLAEGRGTKADDALDEALLRFPAELSLYELLAELRLAEGRACDAILALDTGLLVSVQYAPVRVRALLALRVAELAFKFGLAVLARKHLATAQQLGGDPELRTRADLLREEWGEPSLEERVRRLRDPERVLAGAQLRIAAALSDKALAPMLEPAYRALRSRDLPNLKKELVRGLGVPGASPALVLVLAQLRVDLCLAEGQEDDARRLLARGPWAAPLPAVPSPPVPVHAWQEFRALCTGTLAERDGLYAEARRIYAEACAALPASLALAEALGDVSLLAGDRDAALAAWRSAAMLEPSGTAAIKLFAQLGPHDPQAGASDSGRAWAASSAYRMFALATAGGISGSMTLLEAVVFPGAPGIEFTGSVGSVGQEAARAAHACLRAKAATLGITAATETCKLHMHFTDAYVSKDGPSAGLALALLGLAAFAGVPLVPKLAATGAITIGGVVEGVGGVTDKLVAAFLAGASVVLVPRDNLFDVRKLPERVRRELRIVPVARLEEALPIAFGEHWEAMLARVPTRLHSMPKVPA
jgi:tetratricopeptide (TPR) repeat protein